MAVTPLYAALCALLLVILQWRVASLRDKYQNTRMQEDGHTAMTAATRAVAHTIEYTPTALLLMLIAETQGTSPLLMQALGILLIAGRVIHLKGLGDPSGKSPLRRLGTRVIWLQIILASALCAASSFDIVF